jgi:hypothetical protein
MDKSNERIAVLETKIASVEQRQEEILQRQEEILTKLDRYQGFIGGVMFVFSCLGVFIGAAWAALKHKFGA